MPPILTRAQIDILAATIKALAFRNIDEMQGCDDEAVYEISLLLDLGPRYIIHRAQHLIGMVDMMPYKSINSRNLWQQREWNRVVFDLIGRIDIEVNKILEAEKEIDSMHEKYGNGIHDPIDLLNNMKIDKRWTENTIPRHVRAEFPFLELSDEEILDIVLPEETVYYEDNQLTNIEYVKMIKERRS